MHLTLRGEQLMQLEQRYCKQFFVSKTNLCVVVTVAAHNAASRPMCRYMCQSSVCDLSLYKNLVYCGSCELVI